MSALVNSLNRLASQQPIAIPNDSPSGRQSRRVAQLDGFPTHSGHGLSIAKLQTAYRNAENGWPETQCDIFDDRIEADAHLRSHLEHRVESVARQPWIVLAGGNEPEDTEAALMLERAIRDHVPNFITTLEHQLRSNWYGFAYSEIMWERRDGLVVPAWFENVIPQRFRFDGTDNPLLIQSESSDGVQLTPGKWWGTTRHGRLAAMSGLMRTACYWSHFKTTSMGDWMLYQNRFGLPYVTGVYEQNASDETIAVLKTACRDLGTDGYSVFSNLAQIAIHQPADGGNGARVAYLEVMDKCNAEVSKIITGSTLTSDQGSGPGSHALGKVHEGRSFELKQGDANRIAETFASCVGEPFVVYNGLNAATPTLKIHLELNVTVTERMEHAAALIALGADVSKDQMRKLTMLKEPSGPGDALSGAADPEASDAPKEGTEVPA